MRDAPRAYERHSPREPQESTQTCTSVYPFAEKSVYSFSVSFSEEAERENTRSLTILVESKEKPILRRPGVMRDKKVSPRILMRIQIFQVS